MKPIHQLLGIIILIILLVVAAALLLQQGVDELRKEEVRKDSSRVDYSLVCTGEFGAEAAERNCP